MDNFRITIKEKFATEIDKLDLTQDTATLELKYNTIVENILEYIKAKKDRYSVPYHQTSNNNNISFNEDFSLCAGKSSDIALDCKDTKNSLSSDTLQSQAQVQTTIPNDFTLDIEMTQFAKSKFIQNVEEVFENFKLYYQSKGITNSDWKAVWKKWVLNQNKYKNHLVKTTIDEDMKLDQKFKDIAKKYIPSSNIEIEFVKFKNHYVSNGDLKVSWERVWENWCINFKQFNQGVSPTSQEKATYKWNFKKAKEVSDKIKDWLEFDQKINWLDDYYWKGKSIPGIGWQRVAHPDFNKEEILLYKINSEDGSFMLQHSSNDTIDVEVLEND
jgi:hypothetical protein